MSWKTSQIFAGESKGISKGERGRAEERALNGMFEKKNKFPNNKS